MLKSNILCRIIHAKIGSVFCGGERSEISNLLFRDISNLITENKDDLKPS